MSDAFEVRGGPGVQYGQVPVAVMEARMPSGALAVFLALTSFAGGAGGCRPSVETLSRRAGGRSRSKVHEGLTWLVDNGWILRHSRAGLGGVNVYDLTPAWDRERERCAQEALSRNPQPNSQCPDIGTWDVPISGHRTNQRTDNPEKRKKETEKERKNSPAQGALAEPLLQQVQAVFDHWVRRRAEYGLDSRAPRLTRPRRDAVVARLRDGYPLAELLLAVDGVIGSEWHRVNGHTDLTSIMRPRKIDAHVTRGQQQTRATDDLAEMAGTFAGIMERQQRRKREGA